MGQVKRKNAIFHLQQSEEESQQIMQLRHLKKSYAADVTDEFVVPTVITENGKPLSVVKP